MADVQRILVVVAHPDDAEFGCAGSVARWVADGAEVHYCLFTSGNAGSDDPTMTPERLAAVREAEQRAAARVLGVKSVAFLHYPDGDLEDTRDARRDVIREIRRVRPDRVVCQSPFPSFNPYSGHRDHRHAGRLTLDAVYPYARDRMHFPELLVEGFEPHKVREGYANFDLESPALKLALNESKVCCQGVLNHLGILVETAEEVEAMKTRLEPLSMVDSTETEEVCCHARQTKLWAKDPDGKEINTITLSYTFYPQREPLRPVADGGDRPKVLR